ncbi:hypothetical protein TSAR_001565 [Trichomalopsis sarcophagae]|uniref:Uncharacterized protein n=1 Tax=Trichomalopsis sarcophagae TaxID=543379 RepID=A0A232EUX7_9HYME|nr:hypothetical protein TSAR_001565 [Trichomalopsis sarcophagae]
MNDPGRRISLGVGLLTKETINKNSINIYGNKSSFATRGYLRSQNTNIATATLPEVPGAQGGQYHVVS